MVARPDQKKRSRWRALPVWMLALGLASTPLWAQQPTTSSTASTSKELRAYQQQLSNYLKQVDRAANAGQTKDARAWLKRVVPYRKYLSPADQALLSDLQSRLEQDSQIPPPPKPTPIFRKPRVVTPQPESKPVIQRTSHQVRPINTGLRFDPVKRLMQARALFLEGRWEVAQVMADDLLKLPGKFNPKGDTPKKLLSDIRSASRNAKWLLKVSRAALKRGDLNHAEKLAYQAEKHRGTFTFPFWGDTPSKALRDIQIARKKAKPKKPVVPSKENQQARALLKQADQMLRAGNFAQAKALAEKAKALNPKLGWWETTPEKILNVVRQQKPGTAGIVKRPITNVKPSRNSALSLLKQGRDELEKGNLSRAQQILVQVQEMSNVEYGMFDDTPKRFAKDIADARRKNERKKADQLLAEARKLFQQDKLEEAKKLAYQAQKLQGPPGLWNFGDQPHKLLAEIRVAEQQKAKLALLKKATPTKPVPGKKWIKPSPDMAKKIQAAKLLTEARMLQKNRKILEARVKAAEAQKIGASFAYNEDSPERAMQELSNIARRWTDYLVRQATATIVSAKGDKSAAYKTAQAQLNQAKYIAKQFGHDVQPIDARITQIAQLQQGTGRAVATDVGSPVKAAPTFAKTANPKGVELLKKARLELRKGEMSVARKLTIDAYNGKYGVKKEASALLREIDAEDNNQRMMAARRAFDAGAIAFQRGQYGMARAVFLQINSQDLDPVRQGRLRELMSSPRMGTKVASKTVPEGKKVLGADPSLVKQVKQEKGTGTGRATATDGPIKDIMTSTKAMETVLFQQLRQDSLEVQTTASDRFRTGEYEAAIEMLQDFITDLSEKRLPASQLALIRRPIESRIQRFRVLKTQKEIEARRNGRKTNVLASRAKENLQRLEREKEVGRLMKEFYAKYKRGKYDEALVLVQQARELDPDNDAVEVSIGMTERMIRIQANRDQRKKNDEKLWRIIMDNGDYGDVVSDKNPLYVDKEAALRARKRGTASIDLSTPKLDAEREIESMLRTPFSLNFKDQPLEEVIEHLRQTKAINIEFERHALTEMGIAVTQPVSVKLERIQLKSALNILLNQLRLTWVIKDSALMITTEKYAKGKLARKAYQVVDLITPIENYTLPVTQDLQAILAQTIARQGGIQYQPSTPIAGGPGSLRGGMPAGAPSDGGSYSPGSQGSPFASAGRGSQPRAQWSQDKKRTMEEALRNLIVNAVKPETWADNGGSGTIDYYPLTTSLVINQTQDIQEQIQDLLASLRRLQDLEVALEIRLITVADGFFERMGVDFSMNIKTNNHTRRFEPQITTGNFAPAPFINDFNPSRLIVGTTPAGTFTSDLDIPIAPTSFARAIPPFGGFQNAPGNIVGDGGLTLGLAFLSDIQVFMFMEAAQGDQRTNIMQAPKLTMFNGQTATLTIGTQQFFVLGVNAFQAPDGQIGFIPQNTPLPININLTFQPVVSADRRFVRLSGAFSLTNLASAIVPLFPTVTTVTPVFQGGGGGLPPTVFTQFVQQPTFATITVQTTVVVPDGGTVLLGGLKRLSEGRNEFGPPILSKLPYINRLFKNVGYGRESESILMMVTPRIIITEEEEIRQTGVISSPQLTQ